MKTLDDPHPLRIGYLFFPPPALSFCLQLYPFLITFASILFPLTPSPSFLYPIRHPSLARNPSIMHFFHSSFVYPLLPAARHFTVPSYCLVPCFYPSPCGFLRCLIDFVLFL